MQSLISDAGLRTLANALLGSTTQASTGAPESASLVRGIA